MIQHIVQASEGNLVQLIDKAIAGEEVIIESAEKRQFKLVPIKNNNWVGMDNGKIWIAEDFDEIPADFAKAEKYKELTN